MSKINGDSNFALDRTDWCMRIVCLIIFYEAGVSAIQIDGPLEPADGSNVTLTCIVKGSFRFMFLNSDNVRTAIGECTAFDDCYLYSSALRDQYEITKTDEGATLTIINIDGYRFGVYSCSALFNATLSDSIRLQQKPQSMDFTNTCTDSRRHSLLLSVILLFLYCDYTCL
ncbi:uncharacterized protein LOC127858874 [Dreissena polymorpha]|uniref:Uncharacterized protein n=1 Tax=Dreissena polymorpha TaxID=45954 RepID=A0A9D3Z4B0_DREPO|nr:uncharacterized protein LOC127858874 [Dreissena polymorpha]KAH3712635.1 hypothetical protein DPMN_072387 [Dreissena polymorpha]